MFPFSLMIKCSQILRRLSDNISHVKRVINSLTAIRWIHKVWEGIISNTINIIWWNLKIICNWFHKKQEEVDWRHLSNKILVYRNKPCGLFWMSDFMIYCVNIEIVIYFDVNFSKFFYSLFKSGLTWYSCHAIFVHQ